MRDLLRIGFVDLNLENYHANVFLASLRHEHAHHAKVAGCHALQTSPSQAWAEKNNVRWFESVKAMDEHVDAYMILAPSNPEVHLQLVSQVAPMGKPIYLDKPSAPDIKTLEEIYQLVDRHSSPLQTSSVLRYTDVQDKVASMAPQALRHISTWAGGRSFDEYAIHPIELAISCMGGQVVDMLRRTQGDFHQLLVNFTDGRTASIHSIINVDTPFSATLVTHDQTLHMLANVDRLFEDATKAVVAFLQSRSPTIAREESMAVMRILDAARKPAALKRFISLNQL